MDQVLLMLNTWIILEIYRMIHYIKTGRVQYQSKDLFSYTTYKKIINMWTYTPPIFLKFKGDTWGNFLSNVAGQSHDWFLMFWLDDCDQVAYCWLEFSRYQWKSAQTTSLCHVAQKGVLCIVILTLLLLGWCEYREWWKKPVPECKVDWYILLISC